MKSILSIVCLLLCSLLAQAQEYTFQTQDLQLTVNGQGMITDVSVCGHSISDSCPILVVCNDAQLAFPMQFDPIADNQFKVIFDNGNELDLEITIHSNHLRISVISHINIDALLFTPFHVSLNERVGEIIGIVQGQGIAFGIQALTPKTQAGFPLEYAGLINDYFHYEGNPNHAAVATDNGSNIQFYAWDRSRARRLLDAVVLPVEGEDAHIEGASIALFGCPQEAILERITEIEFEEGLPQTTRNTKSYLISNYSERNAEYVQEKCRQAGLDWGLSVLANRISTNSRFVGPTPSKHLLIQGELQLQQSIDATQTEMAVYRSELFNIPATINVLLIDNELITFRSTEPAGNIQLLYICTRGAFGTKKAAHSRNATVYKLWDTPERTLLPDLVTQNQMTRQEAERCANTNAPLLIFNDLKSYAYNGHGDLAISRFLQTMSEHNPVKLLQADLLTHASWHYLARVNENKPWNENLRNIMVQTLAERQDFYCRNLFPWMIGNFNIHLADKMKQATTLEELEWFLSNAAAFDAGFGLEFDVETMRKHGLTEEMLNTINLWESLRLAQVFTDEQKELFKDPYSNWHIEKDGDSAFSIYPQYISRRFLCNLNDDHWTWSSPYKSRFALRIAVEGKGNISELSFSTPNGILYFPCTVKAGQHLVFNFDGTAYVTDLNYNKIEEVFPQGIALLEEGPSEIAFTCEVKPGDNKKPEVSVRYITRGKALQ